MAKDFIFTRGANWSAFLDRKAANEKAKPGPAAEAYSVEDGNDRLSKIFENSLRADLQGDNKRCKRNTGYGACGHAPKLRGDLYCEFHKDPAKFVATGFTVETFANHPRIHERIQASLPASKPGV